MKDNKWYNKLFGIEEEIEDNNYQRKRMEVYELFKKNKFKRPQKNNSSKQSST
tara:strand:+ start:1190 stop:1348 length:159 start_codon:yes stop_codon:yes gene_type:complete